jgi:hypothetical protein
MIETLATLVGLMRQDGAQRIYFKKLASNDNSKNQIYLGGDFSALNIIPHGSIKADDRTIAGSVRDRAKAPISFFWIDETGKYAAPNAQLILYPKYPEVRMSGFLKNCKKSPKEIMVSRSSGRLLFLGVTADGRVLGHAVSADSALARAISSVENLAPVGVFLELPDAAGTGTRIRLLSALKAVHEKHWIRSQKLDRDGLPRPYDSRNGGGYTLEAELGIKPNGYSDPDYLGWEIKQYSVLDFTRYRAKSAVTLLTPEPTGGIYQEEGFDAFMRRYSYADKSGRLNRQNFGGIYACNKPINLNTGLYLALTGYDRETSRINDIGGGVALLDREDRIAAFWEFTGIIEHWNRKHAKAAYVPSLTRSPPLQYRFGAKATLCLGTDLGLFLRAIAAGKVYLDPALKRVLNADGSIEIKKRNQFRISHNNLSEMYHSMEVVSLIE